MQAKARLADPAPVLAALVRPDLEILHERHYREYDTYFSFADPRQGQLRHREDEFIDPDGKVINVRYRLTLPARPKAASPTTAALALPLPGPGPAQPPLLPRILQAGARALHPRTAGAGVSSSAARSSTSTSTG